jgi:hypothetical protein
MVLISRVQVWWGTTSISSPSASDGDRDQHLTSAEEELQLITLTPFLFPLLREAPYCYVRSSKKNRIYHRFAIAPELLMSSFGN